MERQEALSRLRALVGEDLRVLAERHGVTICKPDGKTNKGWAGHAIERYLGLALNSSCAPNFGSWELKVVPLKRDRQGHLRVKETMAITMIDPVEVEQCSFEDSHLYGKLMKQVVVGRVWEGAGGLPSPVHAVVTFDLDDASIRQRVRDDYELVRRTIRHHGFAALSGRQGVLVQPRTKGRGHGSVSRAFYARKEFVAHILGLEPLDLEALVTRRGG